MDPKSLYADGPIESASSTGGRVVAVIEVVSPGNGTTGTDCSRSSGSG
jgi:hypothetical protein